MHMLFQIHIVGLPAHLAHFLQPLDLGVFREIRAKYFASCDSCGIRGEEMVARSSFPSVWSDAILEGATPSIVKDAFKRCGLVPFDPLAVDLSKIWKPE